MVAQSKKAIAMIELIFALVIMGIVLMSAPMLIQQSVKSSNVALQQEAITAAASHTSMILSMYWDEENSIDGNATRKILDINSSGFNYPQESSTSELRKMSVPLVPSISVDINETNYFEYDDVDDFDGSSLGLVIFNSESTTADVGDYVDVNIEINTTVTYADENNISLNNLLTPTNIKFINVNLTSTNSNDNPELQKNITLKAFSCNIGSYRIKGN